MFPLLGQLWLLYNIKRELSACCSLGLKNVSLPKSFSGGKILDFGM